MTGARCQVYIKLEIIIDHPLFVEAFLNPERTCFRHFSPQIMIRKDPENACSHGVLAAVYEDAGRTAFERISDPPLVHGNDRRTHGQGFDHPDTEAFVAM